MTRTSPVARNTVWNLLGLGAPLIAAFFAIPVLVHGLGVHRFGVLTLAWTLLGYLSLFDLGIGRALTRLIASGRGAGRHEQLGQAAATAVLATIVLGIVVAVVGIAGSRWVADSLLRSPPELRDETRASLVWLALSMPFVLSTAALRGILEAHDRFGMANAIRLALGTFHYLAPVVVLRFTHALPAVVMTLALGRVAAWIAHVACAGFVMPELRGLRHAAPGTLPALIRDGGWMTVSNIVGPVIVYVDRFMLGALASTSAVTYYATPSELVSRLLVIPTALAGALFPTFASEHAAGGARVASLYRRGLSGTLLLLFPPALLISAFAPELLRLWVGPDFAARSATALRWLSLGVLLNSLAYVPFTFLQAAGRSIRTAQLHLAELPVYVLVVWWAIRGAGIDGAAIAWTGRVVVDTTALFVLAGRRVVFEDGMAAWFALLALACVALLAVDLTGSWVTRAVIAAGALVVFGAAGWHGLLDRTEREWIHSRVAAFGGR